MRDEFFEKEAPPMKNTGKLAFGTVAPDGRSYVDADGKKFPIAEEWGARPVGVTETFWIAEEGSWFWKRTLAIPELGG
jgi:hypothetical protein